MEERDVMELDVLFVGGGVSCLSGAIHLMNLIERHNAQVAESGQGQALDEVMVAVLEKAAYVGGHSCSGAVIDPRALKELVPDFADQGAPLEAQVTSEEVCLLTKGGRIKAPITPPPLDNHGNYVISLAKFTEWLGQQAEAKGIEIFPGFAGTEVLFEGDKVIGVRTGDKGIGHDGEKKANFEPGIDLQAKVTVFGEGPRGSLTKGLIKKLGLDQGKNPQTYVVGVKEVWELPEGKFKAGHVIHTMGYPHSSKTYGGGFVYGMADNRVSVGLLTGLDYDDPYLDPHREFQKFKLHPYVAEILGDGKIVQYGAKTAPVGGYWSIPELAFDGGVIVGDSASLFVTQKLKGVHTAMKSGMLAAEAIFAALLAQDFSKAKLTPYQEALYQSYVGQDLRKCRNFHQAFHKGLWSALLKAGLQYLLGGKIIKDRLPSSLDYTHMRTVAQAYGSDSPSEEQKGNIKFDGERTFDKETDAYYSGTIHEEQQPAHLKIGDLDVCMTTCTEKFDNPCVRFCPASVYEMEVDEDTGKRQLKINFSNCLHCKTCDVKDPFENITWVPPEGGGGPKYTLV